MEKELSGEGADKPTIRAKAEEDLDAWSLGMPCLMPHLQLPAQNIF